MKRVLVFDSGVGGLSVLDAIAASGVAVELDFLADSAWLPYGSKPDADVAARVPDLLKQVAAQWRPDLIVIACNTASTIALATARAAIDVPIVGVVPPIKPAAAATKSGVIGLLATPATARRAYTGDLIAQFAADKVVIRVGSTDLVEAAEAKLRGEAVNRSQIQGAVDELFGAADGDKIDVVALSCTHFPLLATELAEAAPRNCVWLDSGAAIARRVREVLALEAGPARAHRAGFTDASAARELEPAFRARGFTSYIEISPAPPFHASLLDL